MLRRINPKWNEPSTTPTDKGQSLVEMAIITPLLLLLFIGVLEVGWAIRGYIVLLNADREATRFAARGQYLDFSQTELSNIGYDYVAAHAINSISKQLDYDVSTQEPNGTLIISHYLVDTGKPCKNPPCNDDCDADPNNSNGGCDCSTPERREPDYPLDDLVLHPGMPGFEQFTALYGITRETQINADELVAELKQQNDAFNCSLNAKDESVPWVPNSVVAVEAWYDQPQLLGVPLISNYLTDPIPLYAQTVMRITAGRGGFGSDGPVCQAIPITFHENIFPDPDNPPPPDANFPLDIYEGGDGSGPTSDFGWLTWDPHPDYNNDDYVAEELSYPNMALNDFTDACDFNSRPGNTYSDDDDTGLSIGDCVSTKPGVGNSDDVDAALQALVGKTVIVVVHDGYVGYPPPDDGKSYYTVSHFAEVRINGICLPRHDPTCQDGNIEIHATFVQYVDGLCVDRASPYDGGDNSSPVAVDDTATVPRWGMVVVPVLDNDSDPDGDALTVTNVQFVTTPAKGTVSHDGTTITYIAEDRADTYDFVYSISDGKGGFATGRLVITVTP